MEPATGEQWRRRWQRRPRGAVRNRGLTLYCTYGSTLAQRFWKEVKKSLSQLILPAASCNAACTACLGQGQGRMLACWNISMNCWWTRSKKQNILSRCSVFGDRRPELVVRPPP